MAVVQQQAQEQGFKYHFTRSNYVTWFTDWLLGLGGKSAHVVLIFTMLYMSAELYPGVSLPPQLNIAVFLLQMFALDMGGMGLASLARQARADGNTEGADKAQNLSGWLIRIMIAGLVTVCVEQAISHIPGIGAIQGYIDAIKLIVEVGLVVARAICAVLYGVTIHSLEAKHAQAHPATPAQLDYEEIARHLRGMLQQDAAHIDYQAITQAVAPMLEATFRRTIIQEIKATVEPLTGPAPTRVIEARATSRGQQEARATEDEATQDDQGQGHQQKARATSQGQDDEAGDTEQRLEAAYQELTQQGARVSGRALAPLARVNKGRAAAWLRATHPEATEGQGQGDQGQE